MSHVIGRAPSRALPDHARRGWCPSLNRPMPTGDGLLARLHPPLGVLTLAQAGAVARGARRYGNGHIDLTARANLQIRGVSEITAGPLSALLAEAGLGDTRHDGGPQRLTLTSPLAGREPFDIPALANAIEEAGRAVPGLPPKTLVAVGMARDEADLSVLPLVADRVAIVARCCRWDCHAADAPSTIGAVLTAFAATGERRMRDVAADALPLHHRVWSKALEVSGPSRTVPPPDSIAPLAMTGAVPAPGLSIHDGQHVLALDAPFSRCTVSAWERLVAVAEETGAPDIRLSPSRGLVLHPSRPERIDLSALAADFIVAADDPRRAVAACTGAPACAFGSTPTLIDAARLAEGFRPLAALGLSAHVSGCAKGCAKPGPADLTLVGRDGVYAIIVGGQPSDPPQLQIPIEAALERLGRAATLGLAAAFAPAALDEGRNRRPA